MVRICVADTETSGLTAPIGVCEVAWVEIDMDLNPLWEFDSLVHPGRVMEPGAIGIHGITDAMVADCEPLEVVLKPLMADDWIVIGHNISFDLRLLGPHLNVVGNVCTLALSRQYYPTSVNHKLKTMQEFLGLPDFDAHRALGDVFTALNLLKRVLADHGLSLNQVIKRQEKPRMLLNMPFGKHKGTLITDVPVSYRNWLLNAGNLDQDLRYTLERLQMIG